MKLQSVKVFNLFSFIDSDDVEIEPGLTCCIGKNETGKTNFLKCLFTLGKEQQQTQDMLCNYSEVAQQLAKMQITEDDIITIDAKFSVEENDLKILKKFHPSLGLLKQVQKNILCQTRFQSSQKILTYLA